MHSLNSNGPGIGYVLNNHPAYDGCPWSMGFEQGVDPDSFNYEGLWWQSETVPKPTESELWDLWENTYRAQWQQSGYTSPWTQLRIHRDALIAKTDWWVAADRTPTAEQLAYRQALRDLPANTVDPENPVWPTKPE